VTSEVEVAPPIFEFSAGGVVLRDGQVLVIRTRDLKGRMVWTFPKGKLNEGEKSPEAAIREVEEETGWRCTIEAELPRSQYWFQREGQRVKKTVRWFRMAPVELVGRPDQEIEEAAWVPVHEAMERLTYESDRKLLGAGCILGATGPRR
jgi:8-oxo-dGTP pyrophosphatase MutT (NUDIX family)